MKSKKAAEYMNRAQMYGDARKQAEKAVDRAEQDARERAIKAFENWAHKYGDEADEIYSLADFLDYYDDDELFK